MHLGNARFGWELNETSRSCRTNDAEQATPDRTRELRTVGGSLREIVAEPNVVGVATRRGCCSWSPPLVRATLIGPSLGPTG